MSIKDFIPDEILEQIGADPRNPNLSDSLIVQIYRYAYHLSAASRLLKIERGQDEPVYHSCQACEDESALFLTFFATVLYRNKVSSFEEIKSFADDLFLKLFRLRDFSVSPEIVNSHLGYYQNNLFNENNEIDLDLLFSSLSSLLLTDLHFRKIDYVDNAVHIHGFTETAQAMSEVYSFFTKAIEELINVIEEYDTKKPQTNPNQSDAFKEAAVQKRTPESVQYAAGEDISLGRHRVESTSLDGGLIHVVSPENEIIERKYVRKKATIKVKSNTRIILYNCKLIK